MTTEEIIQNLRDGIDLQVGNFPYPIITPSDKPITFRMSDDDIALSPVTRLPNNMEINQYLYKELRQLYWRGEPRTITKEQYKVVKGQIRKDRISAINFLKKRIDDHDFYKEYVSFINTERTYLEGSIRVACSQPMKLAIIDLDINKEESTNG